MLQKVYFMCQNVGLLNKRDLMYSNTISQVCATVMYKLILIFIVLIKYYCYVLYFVSLFYFML